MKNRYEELKNTIYTLYSKEGRSKVYISNLLKLNRKTLTEYINNIWKFEKAKSKKYLKPSILKFYKANKQLIKSRFDNDISMKDIVKELGCTEYLLKQVIEYDKGLQKSFEDYKNRIHEYHKEKIDMLKLTSSREYNLIDEEGEFWKPILGYTGYFISSHGRVKRYAERYNSYYLLSQTKNTRTGRMYVCITNGKQRKNFMVHRLVAHSFVKGFSEKNNTVNHIDGNVENNWANNLEWVSQSENNKHAYDILGRKKVTCGINGRKYKKFIYRGKYEFKTVAAFARFINISPTQARRYLEEPKKHDLIIIE